MRPQRLMDQFHCKALYSEDLRKKRIDEVLERRLLTKVRYTRAIAMTNAVGCRSSNQRYSPSRLLFDCSRLFCRKAATGTLMVVLSHCQLLPTNPWSPLLFDRLPLPHKRATNGTRMVVQSHCQLLPTKLLAFCQCVPFTLIFSKLTGNPSTGRKPNDSPRGDESPMPIRRYRSLSPVLLATIFHLNQCRLQR